MEKEAEEMEKEAKGRPGASFSCNAEDMIVIATRLANFDKTELMLEIFKLQKYSSRKISERTVLNAMQIISNKFKGIE